MSDTTTQPKKKKREMLTSFSIIFILLAIVAIITIIVGNITPDVKGATLGDFLMAPAKGFADAIDVCLFGKEKKHIDVTQLTDDFFGHGGGDGRMISSLVRYFRDGVLDASVTTVDRSVESHYVAMAAEESRLRGGETVRMDEYVQKTGG